MPASNLPGINLQGYAPKGEHDWDEWMNTNLLLTSGLVQLSVRSRTQGKVQSEAAGAQITPDGEPFGGHISIYFNGTFHNIVPKEGWVAYVQDEDLFYVFNTGWRPMSTRNQYRVSAPITASTNIPESALREGQTIVVDSAEQVTLTIVETPAGSIVPDGSSFARNPTTVIQQGTGRVRIDAGAGIFVVSADDAKRTRGPWSCLSIIPISASTYVLAGDLVV